ncbi:MAG: DUF401 family protein [Candidatus Thermoplasmatota archaeon]
MFDLIGIIVGFIILATLIYLKVDFGKAIIIATAALLLLSKPSLQGLNWVMEITLEYDTLSLIAIIIQIAFLGYLYKDSEQVMRMIKELRAALPDRRMVIGSIPALFGLMPMPGGALVSAPMIDDEGDQLNLSGTEKTFLNWWFRHIWFTVYPLSLGLIFASRFSGVNIYKIALFHTPIFFSQIIIGSVWGLKKINVKNHVESEMNPFLLIYELLPIIVALSLNIVVGLPFYITLFLAILVIFLQNRERYTLNALPSKFKEGFSVDLLLAAYGIMVFKGIIERLAALEPAIQSLQSHVPLLIVVVVTAFIIGSLFGHLPGAIGVGFPVLLRLVPVVNLRVVSLLFLFTFLGYYISPIHLCIILTIEYFKIDLKSFYRRMAKPLLVLVVTIITWLLITGAFFPFF